MKLPKLQSLTCGVFYYIMKKNYKMSFNFMFFFLTVVFSIELSAKQYGYLIDDSPVCSIWWAEGAYKIKKDDPVPENVKEEISITSAINEYEPFQIVLRSKEWMNDIEVEVSELIGPQDSRIPPEHVTICHVDYIKIETPTDEYGSVGEWPDPLPPYDGPFTLYSYPRENYPLWFTVYVPQGTVSGRYEGTITITYGSWEKEIPLYLQVRKFSLPEETHIRSAFNLSVENIRRYHNLETREELVKVTNMHMQNFKEHRISPFTYINTDFYYIKHKIYGVYWNGGVFVSDSVRSGKRAVKVEDGSVSSNVEVEYTTKISVEPNVPYRLTWYVKTEEEDQQYTVLIKGYNEKGEFLPSKNILAVFTGLKKWEHDTLEIEGFSPVGYPGSFADLFVFQGENALIMFYDIDWSQGYYASGDMDNTIVFKVAEGSEILQYPYYSYFERGYEGEKWEEEPDYIPDDFYLEPWSEIWIESNNATTSIWIKDGNATIDNNTITVHLNANGYLNINTWSNMPFFPTLEEVWYYEPEYEEEMELIEKGREDGFIAGEGWYFEIEGFQEQVGDNFNFNFYGDPTFNMDLIKIGDERFDVLVDSQIPEGRIVTINLNRDALEAESIDNLLVKLDSNEIQHTATLEELMELVGGSEAKYFALFGEEGTTVFVYVPHFSTHTITIESILSTTFDVLVPTVFALVFIAVAASVILLRGRKDKDEL